MIELYHTVIYKSILGGKKMYLPEAKNERIDRLRPIYREICQNPHKRPKFYSEDKRISLGYLRGWRDNDGALTSLLRHSLAEASELDHYKPLINDDELIVGRIDLSPYEGAEKEEFDRLYQMFYMSPISPRCEPSRARGDHIVMDYEKLLRLGVNGIIDEIKTKKAELKSKKISDIYDTEDVRREEFYDCCLIELEAVLRLAGRYADFAREQAETASESRKAELLEIARVLSKVPAQPAETFREAVQSVHFFTFNCFGLYPLGRPDRYLLPYYERDIKSGTLTKTQAQFYIDSLCLLVSTYVFSRAACGFIVGGTDKNGNVIENDLTYMFITALDHIRMPDPNGALAVSPDTSDELLDYACSIIGKGVTHPALYNDKDISESLINYGVSREDACEFIHSTCAEISLCAKSRTYTTSTVFSMPTELHRAVSGNISAKSVDEIIDAFFEIIRDGVETSTKRYLLMIMEAARNGLQPMRVSALVDDCIARGKSVYEGGARYSFIQTIFVGFANCVDSLVAIDRLVFSEKKLSLAEFLGIVQADFAENEELQQYIINKLPHYGNDDAVADCMAARIGNGLTKLFSDESIYGAKISIPGTFSYVSHATQGKKFGATFDGRKAGKAFSDGCCPVQGLDTHGPTAMINSLTSWDQSSLLGGMVVNMKFNKTYFNDDKRKLLIELIRVFMKKGGIEAQINVVDRATLEDALVHPEDHGDLIVRIGGYSDYFVRLDPALKADVIARTEY